MQEYKVWDAPTRWFHWINFASVLLLLLTGFLFMYRKQLAIDSRDSKFLIMTLHSWIGYVFAVNLVGRLIWGFFGNRYARWRALLPTWRSLLALASDLRALCQRQPYQYVGRSPMSRLAVTVMFLLLLSQSRLNDLSRRQIRLDQQDTAGRLEHGGGYNSRSSRHENAAPACESRPQKGRPVVSTSA